MSLHELVALRDLAGLRELAQSGADLDRCFPDADECVLASAAARDDLTMVKELLELGAMANNPQSVVQPLAAAIEVGNLEMVEVFLTHGADPNACDEDGTTSLMLAAVTGKLDVVHHPK